jgi:hypothetical protein
MRCSTAAVLAVLDVAGAHRPHRSREAEHAMNGANEERDPWGLYDGGMHVFDPEAETEPSPLEEPACVRCGCTYTSPCPGGCVWATEDLCSRCVT